MVRARVDKERSTKRRCCRFATSDVSKRETERRFVNSNSTPLPATPSPSPLFLLLLLLYCRRRSCGGCCCCCRGRLVVFCYSYSFSPLALPAQVTTSQHASTYVSPKASRDPGSTEATLEASRSARARARARMRTSERRTNERTTEPQLFSTRSGASDAARRRGLDRPATASVAKRRGTRAVVERERRERGRHARGDTIQRGGEIGTPRGPLAHWPANTHTALFRCPDTTRSRLPALPACLPSHSFSLSLSRGLASERERDRARPPDAKGKREGKRYAEFSGEGQRVREREREATLNLA